MKVATLNNRFSMQQNSLLLEKDAIYAFAAGEEKSRPGLKASKDRLTYLLEANAAGEFKLKPMLITIPKILGPLRSMLNLLSLCSINRTTKAG